MRYSCEFIAPGDTSRRMLGCPSTLYLKAYETIRRQLDISCLRKQYKGNNKDDLRSLHIQKYIMTHLRKHLTFYLGDKEERCRAEQGQIGITAAIRALHIPKSSKHPNLPKSPREQPVRKLRVLFILLELCDVGIHPRTARFRIQRFTRNTSFPEVLDAGHAEAWDEVPHINKEDSRRHVCLHGGVY